MGLNKPCFFPFQMWWFCSVPCSGYLNHRDIWGRVSLVYALIQGITPVTLQPRTQIPKLLAHDCPTYCLYDVQLIIWPNPYVDFSAYVLSETRLTFNPSLKKDTDLFHLQGLASSASTQIRSGIEAVASSSEYQEVGGRFLRNTKSVRKHEPSSQRRRQCWWSDHH